MAELAGREAAVPHLVTSWRPGEVGHRFQALYEDALRLARFDDSEITHRIIGVAAFNEGNAPSAWSDARLKDGISRFVDRRPDGELEAIAIGKLPGDGHLQPIRGPAGTGHVVSDFPGGSTDSRDDRERPDDAGQSRVARLRVQENRQLARHRDGL